MSVTLVTARTTQPQGATPLKNNRLIVLDHGRSVTVYPYARETRTVAAGTIANVGSTQGQGVWVYGTGIVTYPIPSTTIGTGDFTLLLLYQLTEPPIGSYQYVFGSNAAGGFGFASRHSSASNRSALYIAGAFKDSGYAPQQGVFARIVVSRSAGVARFYINDFSSSIACSEAVGNMNTLSINSYNTSDDGVGVNYNKQILSAVDPKRAWSAAEARAWITNPFSIFAPIRVQRPVVGTVIVNPTLTAAQAFNVTTSSAQARVTFTRP
jgi:hypothetical protein